MEKRWKGIKMTMIKIYIIIVVASKRAFMEGMIRRVAYERKLRKKFYC